MVLTPTLPQYTSLVIWFGFPGGTSHPHTPKDTWIISLLVLFESLIWLVVMLYALVLAWRTLGYIQFSISPFFLLMLLPLRRFDLCLCLPYHGITQRNLYEISNMYVLLWILMFGARLTLSIFYVGKTDPRPTICGSICLIFLCGSLYLIFHAIWIIISGSSIVNILTCRSPNLYLCWCGPFNSITLFFVRCDEIIWCGILQSLLIIDLMIYRFL